MSLEMLALTLFLIYFAGVGGTDIWLGGRIAQYLQDAHPQVWRDLGPKPKYSLRLAIYLRDKHHLQLNDARLNAMVKSKSRFDTVSGIVFASAMLAVGLAMKGFL